MRVSVPIPLRPGANTYVSVKLVKRLQNKVHKCTVCSRFLSFSRKFPGARIVENIAPQSLCEPLNIQARVICCIHLAKALECKYPVHSGTSKADVALFRTYPQ